MTHPSRSQPAPAAARPAAEPVPPVAEPPAPAGRAGWRSPLHRDGLALVLSSALSSGVGLLYWLLAARLFSPAEVGVNSTAVSAMMLLGTASQLNVKNALLRFLPVAGSATRPLFVGSYVVSVVASAITGTIFALGSAWWAPELLAGFGAGGLLVYFLVFNPAWALFNVQDYALTGLGRATVVPVANLVFAVAKLVLLVGGALLGMSLGIAVSWGLGTLLVVLAVTAYLLRRLPGHAEATQDVAKPIGVRDVARFAGADYAGTVFWMAAVFGLPVLVLARLGADAAATYGIVWIIAFALYQVTHAMGQSLVAHLAADPGTLEAARRGVQKRALTLIVPAVAVVAVAAPLVLSIFGPHYAASGVAVLVLTALSAIPDVVTTTTVNAARVRQRMRVLFGLPAAVATVVILASWVLMPVLGLAGVGVAWLMTQTVTAAVILLGRVLQGRILQGRALRRRPAELIG
jgi:O-antigen/teichoic acid export membrane protein